MKLEYIDELISKMEKASLTELSYKDGEVDIVLKRDSMNVPQQTAAPVQAAPEFAQPVQSTEAAPQEEGKVIKAPMVGTFYKASSPEVDPYVKVGDKVENSSVVCILEAMKLFNEIQAETSGEITEILVEDGEMVEYDQPLFRVR
ncbi:acetyl-CoA carboxylase biotin carboxyl carrier protein [Salinicoccus sp. ID82-1]|uniref:Biotin carboxyl carrier protein of acetyl-CoA carboxylase n=1 Tax=Salinicoccus cyprini TaxID=2493691 RepID=A0A558AYZ2_9STAP|nr:MULTISPECIES: acetyl-CoA carboxylase biotin carboxyl carrier protein [Salinicoccus]MCG1009035.1 acetyl-CoA carboxylase biotin carboxyl carrier protein [Salinicoccus sp. ID82-1]TVT29485.1 acetyl-CoA carboxylase biotin carboxyl carrier protein [Salinicoccus cyprini]